MKTLLDKKLVALSCALKFPIYVVGGAVRNYLIDGKISGDIDLAGAIKPVDLKPMLDAVGLSVVAEYKRTGTVVISNGKRKYEYTCFRKEEYEIGGKHKPIKTEYTPDIVEDAKRRDFKCNAVYYDLTNGCIVDPLGGVEDIKNKVLDTVVEPDKVFCSDGLRLMRLARFAGELGFAPTKNVLYSATKYADNIIDIAPERIYAELIKILHADKKYTFSDKSGHYLGLKILDNTRVLDRILPELTLGRNMVQRADFHKYDVLEHSLRCVLYADGKVRLSALLHDVGKPFCMIRDGMYYRHAVEGEKIAERILKRFRADKVTIEKVKFLIREHMFDIDCSASELSVRKFIVGAGKLYSAMIKVKQADFRASLESYDFCPANLKWEKIYDKMLTDGTPFTLKDIAINATELIELGYQGAEIGKELKKLHDYAVGESGANNKQKLLEIAKKDLKKRAKTVL